MKFTLINDQDVITDCKILVRVLNSVGRSLSLQVQTKGSLIIFDELNTLLSSNSPKETYSYLYNLCKTISL